jgi:hypothetical protein
MSPSTGAGSPASFTIKGVYTQAGTGSLSLDFDAAGAYGVVQVQPLGGVNGRANLGGTLYVYRNGNPPYTPNVGTRFPFLTYVSRVGDFAQVRYWPNNSWVESHGLTVGFMTDTSQLTNYALKVSNVPRLVGTIRQLGSDVNNTTFGQTVTFTVTVSADDLGTPTGSATFYDGATPLATVPLDATGRASFSTAALDVRDHDVTAVYAGDANYADGISNDVIQAVGEASTSTSLVSDNNPSTNGQAVTFTATVSAANGGTPTGSVSFYDGSSLLDTGWVDANGQATSTISSLAPGDHNMTAVYAGDGTYLSSRSNVLVQTVLPGPAAAPTASTPNSPAPGPALLFTTAGLAVGARAPAAAAGPLSGGPALIPADLAQALAGTPATALTSALGPGRHTPWAASAGDGTAGPFEQRQWD